jgi:hypothetical protein
VEVIAIHRAALLVALVMGVVVSGCSQDPVYCSFSLQLREPGDGRVAVVPSNETLANPELDKLIQRPDRDEGIGQSADCDAGGPLRTRLLHDGAQIRDLGNPRWDTFIVLDGKSYELLFSQTEPESYFVELDRLPG